MAKDNNEVQGCKTYKAKPIDIQKNTIVGNNIKRFLKEICKLSLVKTFDSLICFEQFAKLSQVQETLI